MTLTASAAITLTIELLVKSGLEIENAELSARAIVSADVWGIPSHGLMRLPFYLRRIEKGGINPAAGLKEIMSTPSVASFDGEGGLGHWQLLRAAHLSSSMARETGIALVSISNSNHCGSLGVYVYPALDRNQLSMVFSNGPAVMPAFGGKKPILSTSPLAAGIPAHPVPIVIDLATSAVARGKIATAAQKGESIPQGWAFDKDGNPTIDAHTALSGMLAPLGGAKGFALALLVESLSAGLSGGMPASEIPDMFNAADDQKKQMISHSIITIDPERITGTNSYAAFDGLAEGILDSGGRIPGSKRKNPREIANEVISLPAGVQKDLDYWSERLSLENF